MRIVSFAEAAVPDDLRREMLALQRQAWPEPESDDLAAWHDQALAPRSVLLLDTDGHVLAALDILSKELIHRRQRYAACGISAMVTDTAQRGRGFGRALVLAATDLMESSGADIGIFTCDRHLTNFYESAGWSVLAGSVLVGGTPEAPYPSDQLDKAVMARFFTPAAIAASCDFVEARIELFPGAIDRLW